MNEARNCSVKKLLLLTATLAIAQVCCARVNNELPTQLTLDSRLAPSAKFIDAGIAEWNETFPGCPHFVSEVKSCTKEDPGCISLATLSQPHVGVYHGLNASIEIDNSIVTPDMENKLEITIMHEIFHGHDGDMVHFGNGIMQSASPTDTPAKFSQEEIKYMCEYNPKCCAQ